MFIQNKQLWISLLLGIILITFYLLKPNFSLFYSNIKQKPKNEKKQETSQLFPEITIKNFNIKEISKDKKDLWILTSKEGKIFKKLNQIECIETICLLKKESQEIAQLKAEKSILDQNSKNLFLPGPVTGNFRELEFHGQNFNYSFSSNSIKTKEQITYVYPHITIQAQESFFDLKENKIEMKKGVRTEILNDTTSNNR